jgi:hypothetical protein
MQHMMWLPAEQQLARASSTHVPCACFLHVHKLFAKQALVDHRANIKEYNLSKPTIRCQAPACAKPSSFAAEAAAACCCFRAISTWSRPIFVYYFTSNAAVPERESWGSVQHDSSTLWPAHAQDEKPS